MQQSPRVCIELHAAAEAQVGVLQTKTDYVQITLWQSSPILPYVSSYERYFFAAWVDRKTCPNEFTAKCVITHTCTGFRSHLGVKLLLYHLAGTVEKISGEIFPIASTLISPNSCVPLGRVRPQTDTYSKGMKCCLFINQNDKKSIRI